VRSVAATVILFLLISPSWTGTTRDPASHQVLPGRLIDYFWDDEPADGAGPVEIGEPDAIAAGLADIAAHGFTDALIGTRTTRQVQSSWADLTSEVVIESMRFACEEGDRIGLRTWLRLDPVRTDKSRGWFLRLSREQPGAVVRASGSPLIVFAVVSKGGTASATDITDSVTVDGDSLALPQVECDFCLLATRTHSFDDLASPEAVANMRGVLLSYRDLRPDGIWQDESGWRAPAPWDEGYEELYPVSDRLIERIRQRRGIDLLAECWQLVEPGPGFVRVRCAYFAELQSAFADLWTAWRDICWGLWGDIRFGVHVSSLESGARHALLSGHADYFPLVEITRAGYFDHAGFSDPAHHADAAFCYAMARSLGKWSNRGRAYINLWSNDPTPADIDLTYDRCIGWGVGYFAHAYGNSFLFGPGYPNEEEEGDTPTWDLFSFENAKAGMFAGVTGGTMPRSEVLFYHPSETYCAYQLDCESIQTRVKGLALQVERAGFPVDFASSHTLSNAFADEGRVVLYGQRYQALVVPCANVLPAATWDLLRELHDGGCTVLFADPAEPAVREGARPFMDTEGRPRPAPPRQVVGRDVAELLQRYGAQPRVAAPAGAAAVAGDGWVMVSGVGEAEGSPHDFSGTVSCGEWSRRIGLCRMAALDTNDRGRLAFCGYDEGIVDGRIYYSVEGGADVRCVYACDGGGGELIVLSAGQPRRVRFAAGGRIVSPPLSTSSPARIGDRTYMVFRFKAAAREEGWRQRLMRAVTFTR